MKHKKLIGIIFNKIPLAFLHNRMPLSLQMGFLRFRTALVLLVQLPVFFQRSPIRHFIRAPFL